MQKKCFTIRLAVIRILSGCVGKEIKPNPDNLQVPPQTDSTKHEDPTECREDDSGLPAESVLYQTDPRQIPNQTGSGNSNIQIPKESAPAEPQSTNETVPPQTQPSKEIGPAETQFPHADPPEIALQETTALPSEPEQSELAVTEIIYAFKRQVASYAAQYFNSYRSSPCTVLSGMSQVAQSRASQLTWNYGYGVSDKSAALACYEYGRFIDATEFGDNASNS